MKKREKLIIVIMALLMPLVLIAQTERWVYQYNGPTDSFDYARSIVCGVDGNLYVAGTSQGSGTSADFTVISLTNTGTERWIYRYNGPGNGVDDAYSIVFGADGNLYAAGNSSRVGWDPFDFMVVSVDTSGTERWVYRYNGPGSWADWAFSIVYGTDGNLYAAGYSFGDTTMYDFTVISLDTSGAERWIYRYNGPGNPWDNAYAIVFGADGNLYAAGFGGRIGTGEDFTVISLTNTGSERWVYQYNGPGNADDNARAIVFGTDGNLYAAGFSAGNGTSDDFTVVSLNPLGAERWVYRYNGPGNGVDRAFAIVNGTDGNIYAVGYSPSDSITYDFTVISLDTYGTERWIYRYNGAGSNWNGAYTIVNGTDGNFYAAGFSAGSGTSDDFTVVSLNPLGTERWVYRYNGQENGDDVALSLVIGTDEYVYAAGTSDGGISHHVFTVISLTPEQGIEEDEDKPFASTLKVTPNPFNSRVTIAYQVSTAANVNLKIYDIKGALIRTLMSGVQSAGYPTVTWNGHDQSGRTMPSGVYFLCLEAGNKKYTKRLILIR